MATPRRYSGYSAEYTDLLRRALKAPVRVTFDSPEQARRARDYLYAFRTAVRTDEDVPGDLLLTAPLISFKLDGAAIIVHRTKHTSRVKEALDADR